MRRDRVIRDCLSLSSGTIAALTGKRDYDSLEEIQDEFVAFAQNEPRDWQNWMECWEAFMRRQARWEVAA